MLTLFIPARRRYQIRLVTGVVCCVYALALFPHAFWRAAKGVVNAMLPSNAFGLVDQETFERVKEETTDREVRHHCDVGALPSPKLLGRPMPTPTAQPTDRVPTPCYHHAIPTSSVCSPFSA